MNDNQPKTPAKKPWPKNRDEAAPAIQAFSDALTQAGNNREVRETLKASSDEVREKVSDIGQIEIPDEIIIIFHEPETCKDIYPYYLPKPDEPLLAHYEYFQGCKSMFQLSSLSPAGLLGREMARQKGNLAQASAAERTQENKPWNAHNSAEAFTAALRRSQYDSEYRKRLTKSFSSAKEAVAEEGKIEIPTWVLILFHEDRFNEKYHMFRLPPLNENAQITYEYAIQFEGFYFVW
jgi:hypothetical protein